MSDLNLYSLLFISFFIPDYLGFYIGGSFIRFKSIYTLGALFAYFLYNLFNKKQVFKGKAVEILLCLTFVAMVNNFSLIATPIFICAIISILLAKDKFTINSTVINLFIIMNFLLVLLQLKYNFKPLLLGSFLGGFTNPKLIHNAIYRGGFIRATGVFGHPLFLGNFFVILLFYYINSVEKFKGKIVYIFMMVFMILMTFSRTSYLLAFFIIVYRLYNNLKINKEKRSKINFLIAIGILVMVPILYKIMSFVNANERSNLYRKYGIRIMMAHSTENIKSFMLGNINKVQDFVGLTYYNGVEYIIKNVDNFYVQYLYDYGFIIFAITMLFIFKLYKESGNKHRGFLIILVFIMNLATSTFDWDYNTTLLFFLVITLDKKSLMHKESLKKVLVVFNGYLKKSGGVAEHAKIIHQYLGKEGYEVKLWSRDELPLLLYYAMAVIHKIDKITPFYGFYLYSYVTSLYIKYKFRDYDYYIFEDIFTPKAFYNSKAKFMAFIHASKAEEILLLSNEKKSYKRRYHKRCKRLEVKLLNLNKNIYTVSNEYSKFLKDYFSMDKEIPVIYNFLNAEDFQQYPKEQRENLCYYVGRLNNRKNPGFLVELGKKLKDNNINCKIKILGDGELRHKLENYIESCGLQDYLELVGLITDKKKLYEEISKGKVLLLPSYKESFSYVLAEAKLLGLNTLLTKGLEVPPYLIDYELELEVDKWYKCILDIMALEEDSFKGYVKESKDRVIDKFKLDQEAFLKELKSL